MPRTILPFIVEDGSSLTDANSYVDVEYADTYMDRILDAYKSAWIEADVLTKQSALVWATQLFDDYIYFPNISQKYNNQKINQFQSLNFPRVGMVDQDGYTIPYTSVPEFVKRATTQLAFELMKSNRIEEPTRGILQATVGSLSVTFDPNQAHGAKIIPRSVVSIVARYGGAVRGAPGIKTIPLTRS